jgi:hypothetical protein
MPRTPYKKYEACIALMCAGLRTGEIAKRLKVDRTVIFDWQRTPEFKELYRSINSELLTRGKDVMISGYIDSAKLLNELVTDPRHEMRDRASAAKFLAETGTRFLEKLEEQEKKDDDDNVLVPVKRNE